MRILLFEPDWRSPISMLVSFFTKTPFAHAVIEIDGKYYDSSETRGDFNLTDPGKYRGRLVYEWTMGNRIVVRKFIQNNLGRAYDYKGVFLYPFRKQDKQKFYCFESALAIAKLAKKDTQELPDACNGGHLLEFLGLPNKIYKF